MAKANQKEIEAALHLPWYKAVGKRQRKAKAKELQLAIENELTKKTKYNYKYSAKQKNFIKIASFNELARQERDIFHYHTDFFSWYNNILFPEKNKEFY